MMRIGFDAVPGEPEICVVAIGLGQVIAGEVSGGGHAPRAARLVRLRERGAASRFGSGRGPLYGWQFAPQAAPALPPSWRVIGAYAEVESADLESRPNPRPAPAIAARVVLALALAVVTAARPELAVAAAIATAAIAAATRLGRWAAAYARREFVSQWRLFLCTLAPATAFLAWVTWTAR